MRSPIAGCLAVAMTFTFNALLIDSASADGFGTASSTTGRVADNSAHNYCWGTGYSGTDTNAATRRTHAAASINNLDSQTIMYNAGAQACQASTDVQWSTTTDPVDGSAQCALVNSSGACDRTIIRINPANMSPLAADLRQTSCHELGHSVGLEHYGTTPEDCMFNDVNKQTYNTHHRDHINAQYA